MYALHDGITVLYMLQYVSKTFSFSLCSLHSQWTNCDTYTSTYYILLCNSDGSPCESDYIPACSDFLFISCLGGMYMVIGELSTVPVSHA